VEVYFPQYGWIEFEPTAGESSLERPSGTEFQDSGMIPGMDETFLEDEEFLMADGLGSEEDFPQDIAGPITGIGGLPAPTPLVGTSIAVIVLTLIAGVWLMRRRMYQGPGAFTDQKASQQQIYYERLLNWTARLKLPLRLGRQGMPSRLPGVPIPQRMPNELTRRAPSEQALTPYEREALLADHLPQGSPFIRRITEIFVHFRYAPRPERQTDDVRRELSDNWRRLRPVLLRAWLRRRLKRQW
jgi:hypothetical protein